MEKIGLEYLLSQIKVEDLKTLLKFLTLTKNKIQKLNKKIIRLLQQTTTAQRKIQTFQSTQILAICLIQMTLKIGKMIALWQTH